MAAPPFAKSRTPTLRLRVVLQVARRSGNAAAPRPNRDRKTLNLCVRVSPWRRAAAMVKPHLCLEEGAALVVGSGPGLLPAWSSGVVP